MASSHGSNCEFFANGYVLTTFLNSASPSASRDAAETTTFGNTSKTYIPGLKDTTLSMEGIYDGAANAVDDVLSTSLLSTPTGIATYCPFGDNSVGSIAYTLSYMHTTYEINTDVGDVAQISAEFAAGQNGRYARGVILHTMQVEGSPGTSAPSFDTTVVSSTNGGGLVVHATAATSLSVQLQDSADNSTFANVGSPIAVASGRAGSRLEFTGTLRRYLRVTWTGTGTFLAAAERY